MPDLCFPGQWFQIETGLHYNWHRHYDPTIGRYTQPDPLGFVDGPSVYAYAKSNPGGGVDRDGRYVWTLPWIIRGIVIPGVRRGLPYIVLAPIFGGDSIQPPKPPSEGGGDGCNRWDCSKASDYQLRKAEIEDEHDFKTDWGATPNSHFDICACKNGQIVIRAQGRCGASGPTIETGITWK